VSISACASTYEPTEADKDAYLVAQARNIIRASNTGDQFRDWTDAQILAEMSPDVRRGKVASALVVCELARLGPEELARHMSAGTRMNQVGGSQWDTVADETILAVQHLCPDAEDNLDEALAIYGGT